MSASYRAIAALALIAAFASGITGCAAEYDHTDITGVRQSLIGGRLEGRLDRSRIEVPAGMIVTGHIVSYNDDNKVMAVTLRAKDPAILEVTNVVSDSDFAFIGQKQGTTEVELLADNKVVLIISAVVVPQPTVP